MSASLLSVGGEDHYLRIPFLAALRSRGLRVVAAGSGDAAPFAAAGLEFLPFRFERFANPFRDRDAIGALGALLGAVRPDLVHSFDTKPNLLVPFAARGMAGVSVVRTINGMGWVFSSRAPLALALRPVYRALHRRAARAAALTVFQNRDDQTYFERQRMVSPRASRLVPGSGVDIEGFERARAAAPPPAQLRETLSLGDAPVVISVARLTRQKGIPTLLQAAALVHRQRPDVRFLLVGPRESEGPFAVSQSEIARHAPYVLAPGRRADVPALLALADLFAFPTEYREGVPRALLEAGLAGLPVVATRMPGCTDVVRDGWNGFLVPPRSPQLLAGRILDLLQDPHAARVMGTRSEVLVRQEFGLATTVDRYAALYAEILDGSAAGG